ncbi:ABC transporter ATP-binding protein [Kineosporia sp. J2-2]|uniref:ABC transporter ATP-binding protein n=1 Tax=Kineosporia corallincola TaxID=2835133 RepID=A0ABS5TME6_9ACTN|nr:ABC transporter ATP-binding protein [Kineosporia corallincola]MBT0772272.1 ABC transporter ATP-binding protein [Kineosporia corallincola]
MTSAATDYRLPIATPARCRQMLRELVRPQRVPALSGVVVLVLATVAGLLSSPLLGRIVDVVATGGEPSGLVLPAAGIALVALVQGLLTPIGMAQLALAGESALAELRERFVEKALRLPAGDLERAGSGDLTSRVTNDVAKISEGVREAVPEFARSGLTVVLTLAALGVLDPRFLLVALLAAPVQALTVRWYLRRAGRVYAEQRVATGEQQQQLLETIGNARTVRAFRLTGRQLPRVAAASSRTVGRSLDGVVLQTGFFGRLNLAEFIGLSGVLVTGFVLVRTGEVSIGTASAAAFYFHGLFTPVNTALFLLDEAQSATASLARLVGVVDIPSPPVGSGPAITGASVTVEQVGHSYVDGHPVLTGVDLDIPAGHRVAVVGASGAGKSTLVKLIAGFHPPGSGTIRLGGADVTGLGPGTVRRTVALVTQEVHVFAGPLADDLRLARPGASPAELEAALDQVHALDWVRRLPEGLNTVVGDGGHALTAAQAQQLALARLVLADPPVAILDEATAEAGSAGARVLESAAQRALSGRTALVVAHRLTQAASADRVVVMRAGRIDEHGTHDELVAAGGIYAGLWRAWSRDASRDASKEVPEESPGPSGKSGSQPPGNSGNWQ